MRADRGRWTRQSIALDQLLAARIAECAALGIRLERSGDILLCRTHTACNCGWVSQLHGDINDKRGPAAE